MPAQSKEDLLAITKLEYQKLLLILDRVQPAMALAKEDDTSIKDVVAHRAHWIALFLGWYRDGQSGKPVFFPAEGYKWNDLKRYNSLLRKEQAAIDWKGARDMLEENYGALMGLLNHLSNEDLYGGPMKGANNAWTTGRWTEASGASHFRSATKYTRARLRTLSD